MKRLLVLVVLLAGCGSAGSVPTASSETPSASPSGASATSGDVQDLINRQYAEEYRTLLAGQGVTDAAITVQDVTCTQTSSQTADHPATWDCVVAFTVDSPSQNLAAQKYQAGVTASCDAAATCSWKGNGSANPVG